MKYYTENNRSIEVLCILTAKRIFFPDKTNTSPIVQIKLKINLKIEKF